VPPSPSDTPFPTPTSDRLLELIGRMARRPVAVLADLVVDRFVSGTPKRISREAPVLILRFESERFTPGGGANAVANIAALGGRPVPLGVVGDDASGRELLADLETRGVDTAGVRVRAGYRTPTKTRILGGAKGTIKQQIVRLDVDESLILDDGDREHFRKVLAALDQEGAHPVLVLSDYGYGAVDPDLVADLRGALPDALLVCDSRFRLDELAERARHGNPRGLDGATPNEEEAEALHGGELSPLHEACSALLERLGLSFLLVTRGSRGLSLFRRAPDGSAHLPVHGSTQVADVTGAGDTVIGTFALALAAGASPVEAAALANYAGGVVVMKMGTATLSPDELAAAVRSDPRPLEELTWERS
jgi:D-glycero-beta-D-manno-heptose-7-phosphate kinase